jgi:hypothetical protein
LVLSGIARFNVEIWRDNPRIALGLSEAQWFTIALMVFGAAMLARGQVKPAPLPIK